MSIDHGKPSALSEISHLFLSAVREKHAVPGVARPVRIPPGGPRIAPAPQPQSSLDLTPEEFAEVLGAHHAGDTAPELVPVGPVTAVIASHLLEHQRDRAWDYARHLASAGQRVGMIEVDAGELRLTCFEQGAESGPALQELDEATHYFEPRHLAEAVEELNADVDRWVVVVLNPRLPEARAILKQIHHWILLTTSDPDGVVSGYRTLKGLAGVSRPRLSVAVLDARHPADADRVLRKISSVCQQFLSWPVEQGTLVRPADDVINQVVMRWMPTHDKAMMAAGPHWQVVESFIARAGEEPPAHPADPEISQDEFARIAGEQPLETPAPAPAPAPAPEAQVEEDELAEAPVQIHEAPVETPRSTPAAPTMRMAPAEVDTIAQPRLTPDAGPEEVIEIPGAEATAPAVLDAVIKGHTRELIECPVPLPMCPDARLAVGRDRKLVLVAVAGKGLAGLRGAGYAYRWLLENRALVAMAVPQFAIDALAMPRLRLMVEHADLTADILSTILQNPSVEVKAYRTLRWGNRTGLLLEAA